MGVVRQARIHEMCFVWASITGPRPPPFVYFLGKDCRSLWCGYLILAVVLSFVGKKSLSWFLKPLLFFYGFLLSVLSVLFLTRSDTD